jgi:hypothetical protein
LEAFFYLGVRGRPTGRKTEQFLQHPRWHDEIGTHEQRSSISGEIMGKEVEGIVGGSRKA